MLRSYVDQFRVGALKFWEVESYEAWQSQAHTHSTKSKPCMYIVTERTLYRILQSALEEKAISSYILPSFAPSIDRGFP